ncbi:hypothetical protein M752DRAFT_327228 [Aspergillus phoenicis ATCC 13157]|uniref:Uncharacterized protein n=1 Tax=Aspergillus phoenicis ATCC 13157 TaxID=1353007 RepID=A0A370PI36_ASPPH|nr:hypothetical protein M752DRAFT_327228 [Aspergillus phoenicis ATCC 13157]
MQFNILCVLTLLVAFVASAAVPEAAPDVTSTYGTWFDVEDFDVTNFKLATRDEEDAIVVAALTLIAAILINARWAPAWGLEGGLKCDTCILVDRGSYLSDLHVTTTATYVRTRQDPLLHWVPQALPRIGCKQGASWEKDHDNGSDRLDEDGSVSFGLPGYAIRESPHSDDENDDGDDVCPIAEVMKDKSSQDFIHEVIILKFTEVIDETMKYIHWALAQLYRTCIPCQ